jgi:hypothetical protein
MIGYYEKYKNKRNKESGLKQRLQGRELNSTELESFDDAMILLNLGLSKLESERLRMTLDGVTKGSMSRRNDIPQSLILKTIMIGNDEVGEDDKALIGHSDSVSGDFSNRMLSLLDAATGINNDRIDNTEVKISTALGKDGRKNAADNYDNHDLIEGMRSGEQLHSIFQSLYNTLNTAEQKEEYIKNIILTHGLLVDNDILNGTNGEIISENIVKTVGKNKHQDDKFVVIGRAGIQAAGREIGIAIQIKTYICLYVFIFVYMYVCMYIQNLEVESNHRNMI